MTAFDPLRTGKASGPMFHLSLPVDQYRECVDFYVSCFDAETVELTPTAVNIFVFGAQITLHDNPSSPLTSAARKQFHFGAVVPLSQWLVLRDRLKSSGHTLLKCIDPQEGPKARGKLLVADPSGNLVEINSTTQ